MILLPHVYNISFIPHIQTIMIGQGKKACILIFLPPFIARSLMTMVGVGMCVAGALKGNAAVKYINIFFCLS
jgi:hypothetical protein